MNIKFRTFVLICASLWLVTVNNIFAQANLAASQPTALVGLVPYNGPSSIAIQKIMKDNPGGVQISSNAVAWHNGTVILTVPPHEAAAPSANFNGALIPIARSCTQGKSCCSSGWWCFYQNANYNLPPYGNGRKLQFSQCFSQSLRPYNFQNQTTSYYNHTSSKTVDVRDTDPNDPAASVSLWVMHPGQSSSNVGAARNDRADNFDCFN